MSVTNGTGQSQWSPSTRQSEDQALRVYGISPAQSKEAAEYNKSGEGSVRPSAKPSK